MCYHRFTNLTWYQENAVTKTCEQYRDLQLGLTDKSYET